MDSQTDTQQYSIHPSVLFLLGTLLLTSCATAMLCAAIMTDHWEYVTWNQTKVVEIAQTVRRNFSSPHRQIAVEWYLDDYVTRIAIRDLRKRHRLAEGLRNPGLLTEADVAAVFLVPMNGGIWTLCVSLTRECYTFNHFEPLDRFATT
ncbi:uncharacterized protein LOC124355629 [Homalodisca vitripennis]|uniref:uncharacterized protein LOC124355629 n=1 Tax=Homalodisca vitripennis TaxID=197043 RepID=UPI001EEB038B|nr:uncharacterized protein LOC124355629 [Homalodisca vitripennis]